MNLTFAYLSILTASMKDGFLGIVAMMACDTPTSCVETILLGGLVDLNGAAKAWKGRGAASSFVWSHGSLTLSFFLSLSFFSIFVFSLFSFLISLLIIFSLFFFQASQR